MSLRASLRTVLGQENVNFLLTNRIPRHALTRFMGWFSKIELPPVRAASIAAWKLFCDVDMADAKPAKYRSLHAAFIRELREGARQVDPDPAVIAAPCDAIVGAFGRIADGMALQIKGFPYPIADLLGSEAEAHAFRDGWFVTMRLTAGMYHRFHAPHDLTVEQVRYISGDTWNVNPIALKRIERLFCKNERAPITVRLDADGSRMVLVPVAAVLVASIRLPWFDAERNLRAGGERAAPCTARFAKGEEMGWFEHGSTIVAIAPPDYRPVAELHEGRRIRMGEALMRMG
ncbi:phosphatidylserine decarboxylase [Altererythrobacter sp. B11]|uniref:archaetidylserine decarboxylase n=1 Tax=Altererythrobacter sp. B11 TaxID=2060312 RepID=UPI000DC71C0D|nr:archaetidylserine decarboxylase [Altererythrobacter sp. B11]BBC74184.1 phosphatidylserine decarboxylase [Altererythrobacter sp. B11]